MSSTTGHTLAAVAAVQLTGGQSWLVQAVTAAVLGLGHLILDSIPHQHLYDFRKVRSSWRHRIGAVMELGIGGIGFSLFFLWLLGWPYFWVGFAYIVAANLFDVIVFLEVMRRKDNEGWFTRVNQAAHSWQKKDVALSYILWESVTLAVLIGLITLLYACGAP